MSTYPARALWLGLSLLLPFMEPVPAVMGQSESRPPSPDEASRARRRLLLDVTPVPLTPLSPDSLSLHWDAFQHEPFEASGMSHLTLPFQYEDMTGEGAVEEAYAFSFFISNLMDWLPGCYCGRHAYFVFKRSPAEVLEAGRKLEADLIERLNDRWDTTHAIGGKLTRQAEGLYRVEVRVFSRKGHEEFLYASPEPAGYFEVLGRSAAAVLEHFGFHANERLRAHLMVPRCNDPRLIAELGRAAFMEERSQEEFSVYRKILAADPGFAEVRQWAGNQGYWKHRNTAEYRRQQELSMRSYLTASPLRDYRPDMGGDGLALDEYREWRRQFRELWGEETPLLFMSEYHVSEPGKTPWNGERILQGIQLAAAHPNEFGLLATVRDLSSKSGLDASMSASVALAVLRCPSVPNPYARHESIRALATAARQLGYGEQAAMMRLSLFGMLAGSNDANDRDRAFPEGLEALRSLESAAQYEAAHELGLVLLRSRKSPELEFRTRVCGMLAGRKDEWEGGSPAGVPETPADADLWAGMTRLMNDEAPQGTVPWHPELGDYAMWLNVEKDMREEQEAYRKAVRSALWTQPSRRVLWIFWNAYQKRSRDPDAGMFLQGLRWLHPDDPWIGEALEALEESSEGSGGDSPQEELIASVREAYASCPRLPWPITMVDARRSPIPNRDAQRNLPVGSEVRAIQLLLDAQRFNDAEDLCLRCLLSAAASMQVERCSLFNHVYHRIERLRRLSKDASPPPGHPDPETVPAFGLPS